MALSDHLKTLSDTVETVNDAALDAARSTIEDYGEPAYYLFTAVQFGNVHMRIDITDEQDRLRYYTKSSPFVLFGKTEIMDPGGKIVARLSKKPISAHELHYITMADGQHFTMSNELFHAVDDITNIEETGWQLVGNVLGLCFNLIDADGEPIGFVEKHMISVHNKYVIGIYRPELEAEAVAVFIQLEKMIADRQEHDSSD